MDRFHRKSEKKRNGRTKFPAFKRNQNSDFRFIIINSLTPEILARRNISMINCADRGLETKLILPFAVPAEDRINAFTKDIEIATIFYLAESKRKKGEGHILKKADEKLVFIAEACYPIWLVSWDGSTLLFDGLGVTSHTFSYDKLPDVKTFNKDIQRSTNTSKAYYATLSRNANYFKNFASKEEKTIEGLITSPDFTQDFSLYRSKVMKTEKPSAAKVVLSPIFNKSEISASLKDLATLREKIDEDVKNLDATMKLLNKTTREKLQTIREKIQDIRKKFNKRIEKSKPRVAKRIHQIQERHDKEINRISKQFERKLQLLHRNQVKLEKTQNRLKSEIKRCKTRIKSSRRRKNKRSETRWIQKLGKIRKTLPTYKKKLNKLEKRIENLETARNLEMSKKSIDCDTSIEEANKPLRELEASREARIRMKQPEKTFIEETTSMIINQINELAKSKKAALNDLSEICMVIRKKGRTLVYLPFYLVRYEMESKKRYDIYPPSIASSMGISEKMKGAFGATKMKHFLQPRSKAIAAFLNQLVTLIQKNPTLEKEVTEAGIHDSILRTKKLRIGVKRGLKKLKEEKWITENDLQTLSKLLFIHTPSAPTHEEIKMQLAKHVTTNPPGGL